MVSHLFLKSPGVALFVNYKLLFHVKLRSVSMQGHSLMCEPHVNLIDSLKLSSLISKSRSKTDIV